MKHDIERLEQFVSLQAEFPEKKDILQYIADMKAELKEYSESICILMHKNNHWNDGYKQSLKDVLG